MLITSLLNFSPLLTSFPHIHISKDKRVVWFLYISFRSNSSESWIAYMKVGDDIQRKKQSNPRDEIERSNNLGKPMPY